MIYANPSRKLLYYSTRPNSRNGFTNRAMKLIWVQEMRRRDAFNACAIASCERIWKLGTKTLYQTHVARARQYCRSADFAIWRFSVSAYESVVESMWMVDLCYWSTTTWRFSTRETFKGWTRYSHYLQVGYWPTCGSCMHIKHSLCEIEI